MRTEDDLRSVLRAPAEPETLARLTAFVHDLDDTDHAVVPMEPAHHPSHANRRRMAWVAIAAACAVVVTVGLLIASTSRHSRQPAGTQPHSAEATHISSAPKPATSSRPPTSFATTSTAFQPRPPTAAKPRSQHQQAVVGSVVRTAVPSGQQNLALWLGTDRRGQLVLTGGHVLAGRPVEVFGVDYSRPAGSLRCGGEKPGFWCGYDASIAPNSMIFVGYVVGDVASVRIDVDGWVHRAKTAAWSPNPQLHLWWLSLPAPANGLFGNVSAMTARDASGKVVARASGAIAHG